MRSRMGEDFAGRRNSSAWAALKSSIARTVSTLSTTRTSFVAEFEPMLTWSSCPCDDGMESQETVEQMRDTIVEGFRVPAAENNGQAEYKPVADVHDLRDDEVQELLEVLNEPIDDAQAEDIMNS